MHVKLTGKFPDHQRSVGAADGDEASHAVQEASAGDRARVDLCLGELCTRCDARVAEEPQVSLGIAAREHIVTAGARAGRDESGRRRVVAIAPHATNREADSAIVREPLGVLHRDGTSLRRQSLDVPEQQVEVDRRRLQVVRVETPIDVRQCLRSADLVDALVREAVA